LKITISKPKLLVFIIIVLSATIGWESYLVLAVPAGSRDSIIPPGGMTIPCTYDIYLDSNATGIPAYLAKDCKTGDNAFSGSDVGVLTQSILNSLTTGTGYTLYYEGQGTKYMVANPIIFSTDLRISFTGDGIGTHFICTNDCFDWAGSGTFRDMRFYNMFLEGPPPNFGGNLFNFGTATIQYSYWQGLILTCSGAGKSCFKGGPGGGFLFNQISDTVMTTRTTNTVSMIDLRDNANSGINANTFGPRLTFSNSGKFAVRIEETSAGTYAYDNDFIDITGDPVPGGLLACYGCLSTKISKASVYDNTGAFTATAPMILLSKTIGIATHDTTIENFYSTNDNSTYPAIKLNSTANPSGVIIISPSVKVIDCASTSRIVIIYDTSQFLTSLNNCLASTYIIKDGQGGNPVYQFGTLSGSISTGSGTFKSTGLGVTITPQVTGSIWVDFSASANSTSTTNLITVALFRTTGGIPSAGASTTGSEITASSAITAGANIQLSNIYVDTGLTIGTAYNYYLAWKVTTTTATLTTQATNTSAGTNVAAWEV